MYLQTIASVLGDLTAWLLSLTVIPPAALGLKTTVNIAMHVTQHLVGIAFYQLVGRIERTIWRLCV